LHATMDVFRALLREGKAAKERGLTPDQAKEAIFPRLHVVLITITHDAAARANQGGYLPGAARRDDQHHARRCGGKRRVQTTAGRLVPAPRVRRAGRYIDGRDRSNSPNVEFRGVRSVRLEPDREWSA